MKLGHRVEIVRPSEEVKADAVATSRRLRFFSWSQLIAGGTGLLAEGGMKYVQLTTENAALADRLDYAMIGTSIITMLALIGLGKQESTLRMRGRQLRRERGLAEAADDSISVNGDRGELPPPVRHLPGE